MGKKKDLIWQQFSGDLTLTQIVDGMEAARRNALRLLEDARVLLSARRFSSAAFLAVIAIEEYGKLPILARMAYSSSFEIEKLWKSYRSHRAKNARWILPALVDSGPKSVEDIAAADNARSPHTQFLEELKQLNLYTDCLEEVDGTPRWSEPGQKEAERFATDIISNASRLISKIPSSLDLLELEAEYLRPVSAKSTEEKRHAFKAMLTEASRRGILSLSNESIEQMVHGQIDLAGAGAK